MVALLGAISFPILERIPLFGDLAISPHGIGIAVGFLLGAILFTQRAQKRGLGHLEVANIPAAVQDILTRAAVGAIIGARLFYVVTHLDQFSGEPLRAFAAWEGGLTFLGGIAGAVLVTIPHARKRGYRITMLLDSAAPGIALGLAVGRVGDLLIGDHIGSPTDFPLAWRCTGNYWLRDTNGFGLTEPLSYPFALDAPTAGCFDVAVHHTALYDFGATLLVLFALLLLERRPRFDGFFVASWVYLYGALRFASDFARQDRVWIGLTGSQWAIVATCSLVTGYLAIRRPWEHLRWAWDLEFDHPWIVPPPDAGPDSAALDASDQASPTEPTVEADSSAEPWEATTASAPDAASERASSEPAASEPAASEPTASGHVVPDAEEAGWPSESSVVGDASSEPAPATQTSAPTDDEPSVSDLLHAAIESDDGPPPPPPVELDQLGVASVAQGPTIAPPEAERVAHAEAESEPEPDPEPEPEPVPEPEPEPDPGREPEPEPEPEADPEPEPVVPLVRPWQPPTLAEVERADEVPEPEPGPEPEPQPEPPPQPIAESEPAVPFSAPVAPPPPSDRPRRMSSRHRDTPQP